MRYFTEIEIPDFPFKIDYSSKIIMMGSCFAENIGSKLEQLKFDIDINPFGILYNPVSIANSLKILLDKRLFTPEDLFFRDGVWYSFSHHGRFASDDREKTLDQINSQIKISSENLRKADYLFLTFGTSWVYELILTGRIVSNCHKVPAGEFRRYRLSEPEITEIYQGLLEELRNINPKLNVIFTVSPIRHWKDGAVENQVSKATLILAINNILEGINKPACGYFPSYEVVMDELRDYRFYAEDMLHLSEVAINHIWGKFEKKFIQKEAQKIYSEIMKIQSAIGHRPFNRNTPEFEKFITNCLKKVNSLKEKYPNLNFISEKEYFEGQINGSGAEYK
jgi:hypothetical protein